MAQSRNTKIDWKRRPYYLQTQGLPTGLRRQPEREADLLRFLFGGLATVAGLVLLFIASFGDPAVVLDQFDWVIAKVAPGHPPLATAHNAADNGPAGEPSEQAMDVVQPSQPPAATPAAPPPVAQPTQAPMPQQAPMQQAPFLHEAPPPSQAQASPSPPAPALTDQTPAAPSPQQAPSSQQIEQAAALRAQREALQQQLLLLRAEMAQASQSVSSLHNQAAQERHDLDALAQQRALAEAQIRQLDASRQQQATQTAQATQPPAPEVNPEQQQADSQAAAAAPTQVAQAAMQPGPPTLPLPPPLPSNPPQPSPQVAAARCASPLPQVAAANRRTAPARLAGAIRTGRIHHTPAASDPGALHAALERLRHEPPAVAPQPPPPGPDVAARGDDAAPIRSADAAFGQPPRANGPRVRLRMARDALQAGRIEDARQYLEEAQLQLVFRPSRQPAMKYQAKPPRGRRCIGIEYAWRRQYRRRVAISQSRHGSIAAGRFSAAQGYGYGRPLGGAPMLRLASDAAPRSRVNADGVRSANVPAGWIATPGRRLAGRRSASRCRHWWCSAR